MAAWSSPTRRWAEVALLILALTGCEKTTPTTATTSTARGAKGTVMTTTSFEKLSAMTEGATDPISGSASSFLIPAREGGRLTAVRALEPLFGPDLEHNRSRVGPPFLVQTFDASTGKLLHAKEVAAGDFGALPVGQEIGFEKLGARRDDDMLEARLYGAYDVLAPAYARGDAKLDAAGLIAAATCKEVFPKYAGPLLLPYYEYLARDFFGWLDKASK